MKGRIVLRPTGSAQIQRCAPHRYSGAGRSGPGAPRSFAGITGEGKTLSTLVINPLLFGLLCIISCLTMPDDTMRACPWLPSSAQCEYRDFSLTLDRGSDLPLYEQIAQQLAAAIRAARLIRGARLPSVRQLATRLGVSPFTTVSAYDQLTAMGLIVSKPTFGFFVAGLAPSPMLHKPCVSVVAPDELDAVWLTKAAWEADEEWVSAGSCALPPQWLDGLAAGSLARKALSRTPHSHSPIPLQGSVSLRERLSARLQLANIHAAPEEILVTDGATQAVELICKAFLRSGDLVAVEAPGSPLLFSQLRAHGARMQAIPRQVDGPNLEALEAMCARQPPRMFFTQSALHNPTGWSTNLNTLHQLLSLSERHGFLIAEDDVNCDLAYGHVARLAQLSGMHQVLYYRSLARTMGPLVRLGFLATDRKHIDALVSAKLHSAARRSWLDESIASELLSQRRYTRLIEQLRMRVAQARSASLKALSSLGIRFAPDGDGLFLWGELPRAVDTRALVRDAYASKILLAHDALFHPATGKANKRLDKAGFLRFNVAHSHGEKLIAYLGSRLAPCP